MSPDVKLPANLSWGGDGKSENIKGAAAPLISGTAPISRQQASDIMNVNTSPGRGKRGHSS